MLEHPKQIKTVLRRSTTATCDKTYSVYTVKTNHGISRFTGIFVALFLREPASFLWEIWRVAGVEAFFINTTIFLCDSPSQLFFNFHHNGKGSYDNVRAHTHETCLCVKNVNKSALKMPLYTAMGFKGGRFTSTHSPVCSCFFFLVACITHLTFCLCPILI